MIDDNDLLDEDLIEAIDDEPISEPIEDSGEPLPDLIDSLLSRIGIKDKNAILFEDESGTVTKKWDDIDLESKINILTNSTDTPKDELSFDEKQLIKTIRSSKMTPEEYQKYQIKQSIDKYLENNNQAYNPTYSVDDVEDDVLYITDIMMKVGEDNITDEELKEMLENAKANPKLFQKQVQAIRQEYKNREDEERNSQAEYTQQQKLEQYNQFAETVENSIRSFTDISGMNLDMSEDEMEELYDFIVGFDQAGISTFGKALNNPDTLVRMAWFALHGDEMIADLNNTFNQEIKASYQRGLEAGKKNKNSGSLHINQKQTNASNYDALDLA